MNTYTVWCQDSSGTGTIWIGTVDAVFMSETPIERIH